jgi:hypothetical protein
MMMMVVGGDDAADDHAESRRRGIRSLADLIVPGPEVDERLRLGRVHLSQIGVHLRHNPSVPLS